MLKKTVSILLLLFSQVMLQAQTTVILPDNNEKCPAKIDTLNCAGAIFNNTTYVLGEEFQASMTLPYINGNGQSVDAISIVSTGVTGLVADFIAGNLSSGDGSLIFYIHGTPSGEGVASFTITVGGQTCTANLTLTKTDYIGSLSGFGSNIRCINTASYKIKEFVSNDMGSLLFITENNKVFATEIPATHTGSIPLLTGSNDVSIANDGNITPVRIDFPATAPANLELVKPRVGRYVHFVLGNDGKLYGFGVPLSGFPVSSSTFTAFSLPPGATSIVDYDIYSKNKVSIVAIDNNGKAWVLGDKQMYSDMLPSSDFVNWRPITQPIGVKYSKVYSSKYAEGSREDLPAFTNRWGVVFRGDDGFHYMQGKNGSWGIKGIASLTVVPFSAPPIKMDIPNGVNIAYIKGNLCNLQDGYFGYYAGNVFGVTYPCLIMTTDNKIYRIGFELATTELTLPLDASGQPHLGATKWEHMHAGRNFGDVILYTDKYAYASFVYGYYSYEDVRFSTPISNYSATAQLGLPTATNPLGFKLYPMPFLPTPKQSEEAMYYEALGNSGAQFSDFYFVLNKLGYLEVYAAANGIQTPKSPNNDYWVTGEVVRTNFIGCVISGEKDPANPRPSEN